MIAAFLAVACAEEPPPEPIRPVRTMVVADAEGFQKRWWPGRAKATLEVDLGFEVTGQLEERSVDVGDFVERGRVMAQLDPRDYQNTLLRSQAERDRARAYYERVAEAAKTGAVSKQELDDARARFNQADAQVQIRQKAVDDTRIVAPFDGVVAQNYVDNFQNVRAKQPVIRFLDVSKIEMVINIPEDRINLSRYVLELVVRFDALPGVEIPAQIKEIGSEASQATRTYPVTLIMDPALHGAQVRPGMAGEATASRIEIPDDLQEKGIEVPESALFSPDGSESQQSFVWIIDEETQTVSRKAVTPVRVTLRGGMLVRGLDPGQRIATAGVSYLREGQQVRVE